MKANIEIYIDKLVVDGFDQKAGRSIGAALEQQLAHLLVEQGLPPAALHAANIRHLDGGQVQVNNNPSGIGHSIAGNIYQSLSK